MSGNSLLIANKNEKLLRKSSCGEGQIKRAKLIVAGKAFAYKEDDDF
jgi:hypothetical protein